MYDYGQNAQLQQALGSGQLNAARDIQPPTIRENITRQIEYHQAAIARLEFTRDRLEKSNLLDVKISDLQEAMRF